MLFYHRAIIPRGTTMRSLLILPLLLLVLVPHSAKAQEWPTTEWTVLDDGDGEHGRIYHPYGATDENGNDLHNDTKITHNPIFRDDLKKIAEKHARTLEFASRWYESLGFWAPIQFTQDMQVDVEDGETYVAYLKSDPSSISSSHGTDGTMHLTSSPDFIEADTPIWKLMESSAVHELYHGIQQNIRALRKAQEAKPPGPPNCPGDRGLDWFIEGTAAAVQIHWIERQKGIRYGHPFKGSDRAAWVRHFDQPLHYGSLPPEHRQKPIMTKVQHMSTMRRVSWACDYGTWYFWYALGDMLGGDNADKAVAYTKFIYHESGSWDDGGLANIDSGLKQVAAAYGAIGPYRDGLYDLYPQFVAQYLTEDKFFGHLEVVNLTAPGLFETESSPTEDDEANGGDLGPLASRAWRVRVHLPENTSAIPYAVRFTLDAQDGSNRDDLHLIVDEDVIGRPVDPTAPYAATRRPDRKPTSTDGAVEYLVRIANVSKDVADLVPVGFTLRVEVDGYYGEEVSDASNVDIPAGIAGELPPGFSVRGPGPWTCIGSTDARAVFDLITPDELGRDVDRALPEGRRDFSDRMDQMEIALQRMKRSGQSADITLEQFQAMRKQAETQFDALLPKHKMEVAAAADEARAQRTTILRATFIGKSDRGECQMILDATLKGREGGAQILVGAVDGTLYRDDEEAPTFEIGIIPAALLDMMRSGRRPDADPVGWDTCTMTTKEQQRERQSHCPPVVCSAGRLRLEKATQGRIAGSFQFDVVRWSEERVHGCRVPDGRGKVVGHFNVTSTDDGYDDNSLQSLQTGSVVMPGAPIIDRNILD